LGKPVVNEIKTGIALSGFISENSEIQVAIKSVNINVFCKVDDSFLNSVIKKY
jgi:hypothetical protein